jgi:glycosyltransferase involved in cell wall biosynthesis
MVDNRTISLVCPYYNRANKIFGYLGPALLDDRIDNIAIVDDRSPDEDFQQLLENVKSMSKVTVYRNVINMYIQQNKRNAISFAKNDWVAVCDNDNRMEKDFFDKIFAIPDWDPNTFYWPAWGHPHFKYTQFNGKTITKNNITEFTSDPNGVSLFNLNNYFLHRDTFLKVYEYRSEVRGADGLFSCFCWLKAGNSIHIVPDLTYQHRISPDSVFLSETDENMKRIYHWYSELKNLK